MKFLLTFFGSFFIFTNIYAQAEYTKFWVQFKDKTGSNYSYLKPQEYLSPRALERRASMGIAINHLDIPVNQAYVTAVEQTGVYVIHRSKWLNGVVIFADSSDLKAIEALNFVSEVKGIGIGSLPKVGAGKMQAPVAYRDDYKKRIATTDTPKTKLKC